MHRIMPLQTPSRRHHQRPYHRQPIAPIPTLLHGCLPPQRPTPTHSRLQQKPRLIQKHYPLPLHLGFFFFDLCPLVRPPGRSRRCVPLPPRGLLSTPTQRAQNPPPLRRMIHHPKQPRNPRRDPRQRPQVGGIAPRPRPLLQRLGSLLPLGSVQAWTLAWMGLGFEGIFVVAFECLFPARDSAGGGLDKACDFADAFALLEKVRGDTASHFQGFCRAFWSDRVRPPVIEC